MRAQVLEGLEAGAEGAHLGRRHRLAVPVEDGDRLPLYWKRAGLKSEAQTKFNLPWAVDLRGHTERRTAEGTPLVRILEIHVGVVEP